MSVKTILRYAFTDTGYCRVYYKSEKGNLYCIQDEGGKVGCLFYPCTADWHEPLEAIIPDKKLVAFQKAKGGTELDTLANKFLVDNGYIVFEEDYHEVQN